MARNAEKAQSMLSLFRKQQMEDAGILRSDKRPYKASEVTSLSECDYWRRQLVGEIGTAVARIQMASLSEYQVRELNDTINKLIREKGHWERQMRNLGGSDMRAAIEVDDTGKEAPGTKGYRYFGRARDLPGVQELFAQQQMLETDTSEDATITKGERIELDAEYYGLLDNEDETLLAEEQRVEKELLMASDHAMQTV